MIFDTSFCSVVVGDWGKDREGVVDPVWFKRNLCSLFH